MIVGIFILEKAGTTIKMNLYMLVKNSMKIRI